VPECAEVALCGTSEHRGGLNRAVHGRALVREVPVVGRRWRWEAALLGRGVGGIFQEAARPPEEAGDERRALRTARAALRLGTGGAHGIEVRGADGVDVDAVLIEGERREREGARARRGVIIIVILVRIGSSAYGRVVGVGEGGDADGVGVGTRRLAAAGRALAGIVVALGGGGGGGGAYPRKHIAPAREHDDISIVPIEIEVKR